MMFRRWQEKRKRKQELARQFAHESAKSFSEAPWILPEDREIKFIDANKKIDNSKESFVDESEEVDDADFLEY